MPRTAADAPLYVPFEGPVATLYAELVERARADVTLLPGSTGSLALRERPGSGAYWYRRYYNAPGSPQAEDFVCRQDDRETLVAMQHRIAAAERAQDQVRKLRHLGLQVADKAAARVLVELYNRGFFNAGLVIVGPLAFMSWLNGLGVAARACRTLDIDLARRHKLKVAAPSSFLEAMQATRLGFFAIQGRQAGVAATSVKRPGREGLRVDILTTGAALGGVVPVAELDWNAQTIPHFDYLLAAPRPIAVLAGGHCIPANAPAPERLAWPGTSFTRARAARPTLQRRKRTCCRRPRCWPCWWSATTCGWRPPPLHCQSRCSPPPANACRRGGPVLGGAPPPGAPWRRGWGRPPRRGAPPPR
ncbi:MAG: hypothetical protein LH480_15345, partial [Rubrivivax sp.]|nr:hypothetical protein [Rubrivivax sp.]